MHFAYLFEAKSIQAYIMASGRLRDLVGASELVDSLCDPLLDDALAALAIADQVVFSRRAGGAFYAFSEDPDALLRLAQLWPLIVQQYAQGLAFDHGLGAGATALAADTEARKALAANRSQARPALPQAGPRVQRSPRTGRPAIKVRSLGGGEFDLLDAATERQRRFAQPERMRLIERLAPTDGALTWRHWPLDLTPDDARQAPEDEADTPAARLMPFTGDARVIGVLHADGNGMGELLTRLRGHLDSQPPDRFIPVFKALSEGLTTATQEAARSAVAQVLLPRRDAGTQLLPARPVVLGGDDLTMILRADVALPFARVFLAEFAERTPAVMAEVRRLAHADCNIVPERLTACAGIAWIKASQPFALAAALAEGITGAVKRAAKALNPQAINPQAPPSSLAFHRVTTAMIDDYDAVLARELSTREGQTRWCHSLGAYGLDPAGGLPALDDLLALQRLLSAPAMARGPARQVLTLLADSPFQAQVRWRRWRTLMADQPELREARNQIDKHLIRLLGANWRVDDLPYRRPVDEDAEAAYAGPLGDLHALMAVDNAPDLPATADQGAQS